MSSNAAASPHGAASWGLASSVVTAGLSYLLQIIVGRFMLPTSYSETQSLLGLYMMVTMPAVPMLLLVTKRVVEEQADGHHAAIHALLRVLLGRTAVCGAVFVAAAFVARQAIASALAVSAPAALPLFALSVVTNLLYLIAQATLLGQFRWRAALALPVVLGVARLVFSLLFVRAGYGVTGVFAAIAVSTAACFALAYRAAAASLPAGGRYRPLRLDEIVLAGSINAAFWFFVQVDTVYVNRELPALAERGYAAAATLAKPLVYFPAAVNNVLFPFLAAATDWRTRRQVLKQMVTTVLAIDLAALAILIALSPWILRLTFGPAYVAASDILAGIASVMAPFALVNVLMYYALARHDRPLTRVFIVAAIVAGLLLSLVTPMLRGMFAILLGGAAVIVIAGVIRLWPSIRGPRAQASGLRAGQDS